MRRAALPLLFRIGDAAPAEQLLNQGPLTQLQSLLLQVTGHIGSSSTSLSRSPSQVGRTLFGVPADADASLRNSSTKYEDGDGTGASRRWREGGCHGDSQSVADAITIGRPHRRGRRSSISLDQVLLVTLPGRSRRPRAAILQVAEPVSLLIPDKLPQPPHPSHESLTDLHSTQPQPPPPSLPSPPTAVASHYTGESPAGDVRSDGLAAKRVMPFVAAPPQAGAHPTAAPPQPSVAKPNCEATLAGGQRIPGETRNDGAVASQPHDTTARPPPPESSGGAAGGNDASGGSAARAVAAARPARGMGLHVGSGHVPRTARTIHETLDDVERGSPPPPPRHIFEALEQWRKRRRGETPLEPGGQARDRAAAAAALATRLDHVLAPHVMGEYGSATPVRFLVFLLWSIAKGGLYGKTALALVRRLEEVVRHDMPYGKGEYWASLAVYSLGLAQQDAAGATADGGSTAARGGSRSPATAAAALVARSHARLAPALLGLLGANAAVVNMQALSNSLWAAGLLGLRDLRPLSKLGEQASLRAGEAQSQNIANIVYGCALLGLSDKEWAAVQKGGAYPFLEQLLYSPVRQALLGFKPPEVSCVAWAVSKLPRSVVKPMPLLEAVAEYIARGGFDGTTSSQVWANTLYAMGMADFYDPRVFTKLSEALLPPPPPTAAAASAAARLRPAVPPPPLEVSDGAAAGAAAAGGSAVGGGMPPLVRFASAQTCANMLFALGVLRHVDERIVDLLVGRMAALAAGGRAALVDVALVVRACAQLNYRPAPGLDELLDAALPAMRAQAPKLMAYNVLWSLLTLGMLDEPRHQPLVRHLVYCINTYGTTTWKSATPPPSEPPSDASPPSPAELTAYDDLTQLVQYHLESRYLGLTGPSYDLTPPYGMETVVRQIRERRQWLAAQSSTVVQGHVLSMLKDMAAADDGRLARDPRIRILSVESEVMLEPELVVVDVLLTLEVRQHEDRSSYSSEGGSTCTYTCKLALEVDGPHHFMRNRPTGHQDGATAYRDRVLRRRLGGLAVVPTSMWVERLRDEGERRRYLDELLAAAVPPPTAPSAAPA